MDENVKYKLSACLTGVGLSLIGFNILYTVLRYSQTSHLLWKHCLVGVLIGVIMFIIGVSIDKTFFKSNYTMKKFRATSTEISPATQASSTTSTTSTGTTFCRYCGTPLEHNAAFCVHCGKQVTKKTN